jgi:hypothetical protein
LCAIGDPQTIGEVLARYRHAGVGNPMITQIRGTDFGPTLRAAAEHNTSVVGRHFRLH